MAKRARVGDVLELMAQNGWVLIQYLGKHQEYGDGVLVCPTIRADRKAVGLELFRDGYITFFPVMAAVAQGVASVVGHLPSPGLPKRMRRPGARSFSKVETWIIEDGLEEVVKRDLSDAERRLPIAAIWNRDLLVQRVSEGWRPEAEGLDE